MVGMALAAADAAAEAAPEEGADAAEDGVAAGLEAVGAMLAAAAPPHAASAPVASSPSPASCRKCLRLTDAFTMDIAFPPSRAERKTLTENIVARCIKRENEVLMRR